MVHLKLCTLYNIIIFLKIYEKIILSVINCLYLSNLQVFFFARGIKTEVATTIAYYFPLIVASFIVLICI